MRLNFDAARDANPYNAWATITLIVVAVMLSVFEFRGSDFEWLHLRWEHLPGEPWRYLSAAVLHGGVLHLVMNVMWILQLGILAEAMLGITAYTVLVVLLAGLTTMAQWAVSGPVVGLSGIVYGLFGLLWALDRWHPRCRGVMSKGTAEFFGGWFLICILISWVGAWPIGNTAHGAGFVFGALFGWALSATGPRRFGRLGIFAGAAVLVVLAQLPAVRHVVNHSRAYEGELLNRGVAALDEGRLEDALAIYLDLTERAPNYGKAWNNLAVTYSELGHYPEAAEAGRKAQEIGIEED